MFCSCKRHVGFEVKLLSNSMLCVNPSLEVTHQLNELLSPLDRLHLFPAAVVYVNTSYVVIPTTLGSRSSRGRFCATWTVFIVKSGQRVVNKLEDLWVKNFLSFAVVDVVYQEFAFSDAWISGLCY